MLQDKVAYVRAKLSGYIGAENDAEGHGSALVEGSADLHGAFFVSGKREVRIWGLRRELNEHGTWQAEKNLRVHRPPCQSRGMPGTTDKSQVYLLSSGEPEYHSEQFFTFPSAPKTTVT